MTSTKAPLHTTQGKFKNAALFRPHKSFTKTELFEIKRPSLQRDLKTLALRFNILVNGFIVEIKHFENRAFLIR